MSDVLAGQLPAGDQLAAVFAAARSRFSSLGGDFVFLDAPGGSQVPDEVGAAVAQVYREASGNIGVPYATSRRIEAIVGEARTAAARFLGCTEDEVIFGENMTSLNFSLSRTLGRQLSRGDEIVVTRLDHDANVAPWLDLAEDRGLLVRHADVHADTTLDLSDLARQLGPRTRVVAFPWAANATGTVVDAAAVSDLAHQAGAIAWVDAVQYAPHEPIDVTAIGADVLTCSAYKFCGPHLGIAYGRRELLESWRPYKARPSGTEPVGHRFETGVLPYELLGGLLATFAYTESLGGMTRIAAWERQLTERLLAGLPAGATLYGLPTASGRVPVFLINFPGIPAGWLSESLAEQGFGVWSHGSYYALGLHDRIGWGEALRIGLAHYNTLDEMDRFNEALAGLVASRRLPGTVKRDQSGRAGMRSATVVRSAEVRAVRQAAGASVRTLLDTGSDGPDGQQPGLVRRAVDVPPGARGSGTAAGGGELLFVIEGSGRLELDGQPGLALRPDQGVLLPPGARYQLIPDAGSSLRLDAVELPARGGAAARPGPAAAPGPAARDLRDCAVERTGDRRFRVLFGPGRDCAVATQFVGEIPPGRAPDHSHPYDEVVLILAGHGVAHVGGTEHELDPGTCIHLPPGQLHCLENTGTQTLRVLGVFHPADSPAAKLPG